MRRKFLIFFSTTKIDNLLSFPFQNDSSDDHDDDSDDEEKPTEDSEENWARFDQMPGNDTQQASNSRVNDGWPTGDVLEQTQAHDDDVSAEEQSETNDFLAGGAHLLPPNLRDVPPPTVASLNEGISQLWAG